jgi:hypothetical protein
MVSRTMRVVKEMSFLLKPNESFIDLQLNLLEVREPFNTKHGFMCRFVHTIGFFENEQDAFSYLNFLYRVVYECYLFDSLSELKVYMDSIPEYIDSEYYRIINNEIVNLVNIEML